MKRRHDAIGASYCDHARESDDATPESRQDRRIGMKSLFMLAQQAPGAAAGGGESTREPKRSVPEKS
jgi:hypothetical protein